MMLSMSVIRAGSSGRGAVIHLAAVHPLMPVAVVA